MTTTKLKGRIMGARFKTFSGAARRAEFERAVDKAHAFAVEDEKDPYQRANGYVFCIRKTRRAEART